MKKILYICLNAILLSLILISSFNLNKVVANDLSFDETVSTAAGATFKVVERTNNDTIDYGINYIRDIVSTTSHYVNGDANKDKASPQVLNVLNIPSSTAIRVVNWTYRTAASWTKQSVTEMAKNYEYENPGWVVIAGINGDFFDINGKGALPYQTSGVSMNDGELVRSIPNETQIGFTNNGTANSMIAGEKFETNDYHTLAIYDANGDIVKTFKVDKFNEEPGANEISVYYSYHLDSTNNQIMTIPSTNSYTVTDAYRCYGMSSSKLYAKGNINLINEEKELLIGQFGIVTTNEEVKSYLNKDVTIRVQQDVIGAYAQCDNITGGGHPLVTDSNPPAYLLDDNHTSEEGDRHPRTMIGKKADGTIVMATVDGRQQDQGMYGMTYEELSATMLYYGCESAYNLDGGGSTTMIIRNDEGDFDVMNSPSDGEERRDSNCILVVAPELKVNIDKVTDTQIELSYSAGAKGINIDNIVVSIEDVLSSTYSPIKNTFESNSLTIDNLKTSTKYLMTYEYDLTYNGSTIHNKSKGTMFTTGLAKPELKNYYYEIIDDEYYLFSFEVEDENDLAIQIGFKYDDKFHVLTKNDTNFVLSKSDVKKPTFKITIIYDVRANPTSRSTDTYEIKLKEESTEEPTTPTEDPNQNNNEKTSRCKKKNNLVVEMLSTVSLLAICFYKKH